MRLKRRKRSEKANLVLAAGIALTGAAAVYAVSRLLRAGPVARQIDMRSLEKRVVQALLDDEISRTQPIDISAVGSGVIEVSGAVDAKAHIRHVVDLINSVPGVYAVLNRLDVNRAAGDRQPVRQRNEAQSPRWYGGTVGIGKRRQSASTDPRRRDDHASMLSRAMQPNRDDVLTEVEEAEGTGVRIGLSTNTGLNTHVAPRSPNPKSDKPGAPPEVAPHEMAQRE